MKIPFITFAVLFFQTCAVAEESAVSISLGSLTHHVEPAGSIIAGYKSVKFRVQFTNTSKQTIWYYAQLPRLPFHKTLSRAKGATEWGVRNEPSCGTGAQLHPLKPGESRSFDAWAPDDAGHEFRVELAIYPIADIKSKPAVLSTEAVSSK